MFLPNYDLLYWWIIYYFSQSKESNFRSPEISDVVYDQDQVLEITPVGIAKWEKNASAYWDAEICK